jgi:hypothetical protein
VQLNITVKRSCRFNGKTFDVFVPDCLVILPLVANAFPILDENPVGSKVRLVPSDPASAFEGDQDLFIFFLLLCACTNRDKDQYCVREWFDWAITAIEGQQNEKRKPRMRRNPKRILLLTNNSGYFSRTAASAAEASTWNELLPRKATNEDMMMDDVSATTTVDCVPLPASLLITAIFTDFDVESEHQVVFSPTVGLDSMFYFDKVSKRTAHPAENDDDGDEPLHLNM